MVEVMVFWITLKMEVATFSETLVSYVTASHHYTALLPRRWRLETTVGIRRI
jgi:hypothetical protein